MISVTGVSFSADSRTLLSYSADSSARCTPFASGGGGGAALLTTLLLILAVLAVVLAAAVQTGHVERAAVEEVVTRVVGQAKALRARAGL